MIRARRGRACDNPARAMTPPRKRQVRLVVSLVAAVLLAAGLIYTSFAASDPALEPSQLLASAGAGKVVQLTGTVVPGTVDARSSGALNFRLADRANSKVSIPVDYSGSVPSAFRPGRELIVTGALHGRAFVAQPDSMITKCPSKYVAAPNST
jgi:cytochrome c-type biogenesis protein CcmE